MALLCAVAAGCADDHGSGAMHAAVSRCFAQYPFQRGTAYARFRCIADAHAHYGSDAVGRDYRVITQVDAGAQHIGRDVDSGTLTIAEAETALHWVTTKAQRQAAQSRAVGAMPLRHTP